MVGSRHDELASHHIQFMPAHERSTVRRVGIGARADAELVVIDVQHPFCDGLVHPVHNVGRHVASYWVARTSRTYKT